MKAWQIACVAGVAALAAIYQFIAHWSEPARPDAVLSTERAMESPTGLTVVPEMFRPPRQTSPAVVVGLEFLPYPFPAADGRSELGPNAKSLADSLARKVAALLGHSVAPHEEVAEQASPKQDLSALKYYVYSELPPDEKPAEIVLDSEREIPMGTPREEIERASSIFGVNKAFMLAVAKIESDFDPKQRTGSYIGLFQLSNYEFNKYGFGEITNARDNATAAAYKFASDVVQFEWATNRKPSFSDLYLIHQQGWQGAAEHVAHPERIAWESMCATDEGHEKGEKWCKRAIWKNTLPSVKQAWKSVEKLTSGAFVEMWRDRVNMYYARYAAALSTDGKQ